MENRIHIFNGDCAVEIFKKSGIGGDFIVWRELLCEGHLELIVASDEFWNKRYNFFENTLLISRNDYYNKTIKELIKLKDLTKYTEVVLWFEFDLFCQVNLMALCTYLLQVYSEKIQYSLVCTGKLKGKEQLQSLTDFSSFEFVNLFNKRVNLSKDNLLFVKNCWELYVENNFDKLSKYNFNNSKFKYFQLAINQHFKRFPRHNGLNEIENKVLEIIYLNTFTAIEIVQKLLIWQYKNTVYGFADTQYFLYLKELSEYYSILEFKYYLNTKGKFLIHV